MAKRFSNLFSSDLGALTILILGVLFFGGEMVWDGKVPFFRDLNYYFYPLRHSLGEACKAGEIPLWNRHMGMGFPLLADIQTGVFYPPHLFFCVLPLFDAVRVVFLLHYAIAVSGCYLLLRRWALPVEQALIGALLFTLGGTMVSLTNLLNHFQSAVWLPWVALFWNRCLERTCWSHFLLLVLALACQLLAGSPEVFAMSAALLWLQGVYCGAAPGWKKLLKPSACLVAANLLVLLLAMVQLLPMWEMGKLSRRQLAIPFVEATLWSLNPWTLLNLFLLDKQVDLELSNSLRMFFRLETPFFISYYFGALALAGTSLWLCYAKSKEKLLICCFMASTLVLAFGSHTPVYRFLYEHVGGLGSFRYPEKFFFLTQIFLLVTVLRGVSIFARTDRHVARRGMLVLGSIWIAMVIVYGALRLTPSALWNFVVDQNIVSTQAGTTLEFTASALVSLERQLGLFSIILVLFVLGKTGYLRPALFKPLLVGFVFLDLYSAHKDLQYLVDPQPIVNTPKVLQSPDNPPTRLFYYPQSTNTHPSSYVIYTPKPISYSAISERIAKNLLPNTGAMHGFDHLQDINAMAKMTYSEFLFFINQLDQDKRATLMGALNVRHVMSFHQLKLEGLTLVRHFPETPSWLYQVDRFVPRAYVVQNTRNEIHPRDMLTELSSLQFDPAAEVFVDKVITSQPRKDFRASATIAEYGQRSVSLKVKSNNRGVLVLADAYFPGWRAFVDGKETNVLRVNYFFRGVAVEPGEHHVVFHYQPLPFTVGLWISLSTALVLVVVTAIALWRTRRRILALRARARLHPLPA